MKNKKNSVDFFKSLRQFFPKFNDQEAISKQLNGLNKVLISEKIEKIKKNPVNFFKSLRQFSLKFKDEEAIRKPLTVLIKCY